MNRAVERVKEITGGAELASYPGNVSYRASVPVQAIPLLFPKNEVICAELREFTSVVCRSGSRGGLRSLASRCTAWTCTAPQRTW